jgi:putative inorganic carbon (HCO3(-)) transporter
MRSLLLDVIFFSLLPFIFRWPYLGVLMWFWVSLMNPQDYAYSTLPYALMVAVVTLLAWMFSKEPKLPPKNATAILLCLLMVWVTVTSAFALTPTSAVWDRWLLSEKMFLFTVLAFALTNTRERLDQLIAVCALSIGFIGFVGGIFTINHGGAYRVYGPNSSTVGDNNDFGVALVTMLPLLFYLFQRYPQRYLKGPLLVALVMNFISTLFTYSRGALVAIIFMATTLWLRARLAHKFVFAILFAIAIAGVFEFAPPEWFDRMNTIQTYKDDESAESRLYVWQLSWAMAQHHPVLGAGYRWMYFPKIVNSTLADSGLPALKKPRAAHSIWFQMLSDHGFVGLGLFLGLFFTGLLNAAWIVRRSKGTPALRWANDLGRALQASMIGYAAGGTFASLEMWDGYYVILVIAAAARVVVAKELAKKSVPAEVSPRQGNLGPLSIARPAAI